MTAIIKPDVLNILCATPKREKRNETVSQPQPEPQKQTFWGRAKGFFKKAWGFVKEAAQAATTAILLLNSFAKAKAAFNAK